MKNAVAVQRTPELIAAEINHLKLQTQAMVKYNAIEIGRRLCEAKEHVPHGEWANWLKTSVNFKQSTANNLMNIFKKFGADQMALFDYGAKSQALEDLSYTQLVALLGVPDDDVEELLEEHDVKNMSTRELKKAIKERDEALEHYKTISDSYTRLEATNKGHYEKAEQLRKDLAEATQKLAEAQAAGNDAEVERLQAEIKESDLLLEHANEEIQELNDKINELNTQLAAKPIDVPATVEKIPEDVQRELEALRKGKKSPELLDFEFNWKSLNQVFSSIIKSLAKLKDSADRDKYANAVRNLIKEMEKKL